MEIIALCSNMEYVDFYNNNKMFNSPQSMGNPTAEVNQLNRAALVPDNYGWWYQLESNFINNIISSTRSKSDIRGVNTPLQCSLRMVLKYKERERERICPHSFNILHPPFVVL